MKSFTRRYDTDEFLKLQKELCAVLQLDILHTKIYPLKWYRNKTSHGDMDLLVLSDNLPSRPIHLLLKDHFDEVFSNGGVYSIPYKDLQIDLILTSLKNWEVSQSYFDYDPSGNLHGKLAHKFGLKYGHAGLLYPIRVGTKLYETHTVSKDNSKIFEFLGYNYAKFQQGFNTIEEIYWYIINGKYFNADIFRLENLTQIDRKRNRKRPTYNTFLKFVADSGITGGYEFNRDKSSYIASIDAFFECGLVDAVERVKVKHERLERVHAKWNGHIIMEYFPHLKSERLGKAIHRFENIFLNPDEYNNYILDNSLNDIIRNFKIIL